MWGRPNYIIIIDSSMHTAAEVELGNFLTMMYFENTSTTIRESIISNRTYVTNVCHGKGGSSWVAPMIGCDFPYYWHMIHFYMSCWTSWVILSQKEASLLALVSLVYVLEHLWSHFLWHYDSVPSSNES